eukprot:CAMPEP_0117883818 /NCGR_PEP_ID=MMETSP0950-20121206/18426_1 /TAXON_ID=44440 /ORGANISM="Chattonella subsalsa, Strain CCMP2191" /LENGTH=277 /DNA_ID=CAMNT_0005739897 /DNA_START=171 /DNA_END=1005 /DNA_ORIENTATION=+
MSETSDEEIASTSRRDFLIKGAAGTGTLAVGKYFIDGPSYTGSPDLTGKSVIITGANTGLGKESAIQLAKLGADVCIACRNPDKAAKAANKDGFEYQFGVNHLGHFYLTNLLLDTLLKAERPRIVNLSSAAHTIPPGVVNFDDIMGEKDYQPWVAYGQSKLSNILFTKELQKRLDAKTDKATVMCCHPGAVRTELGRYLDIPPYFAPLLVPLVYFTKSPEKGSQTQTFLCAEPSQATGRGKYFDNCAEVTPSPPALDTEAAKKLWEVSEMYTTKFDV